MHPNDGSCFYFVLPFISQRVRSSTTLAHPLLKAALESLAVGFQEPNLPESHKYLALAVATVESKIIYYPVLEGRGLASRNGLHRAPGLLRTYCCHRRVVPASTLCLG
jgi:hypothetical protein